jgi:N-acetylmuramoyl-L-alanine amidase
MMALSSIITPVAVRPIGIGVILFLACGIGYAEEKETEKKSFLSRISGLVKKKEEAPPTPPPAPTPKSKPKVTVTTKSKPSSGGTKSSTASATKKKSTTPTTEKKETPAKPVPTVAKKEVPKPEKKEEPKAPPAPETAKTETPPAKADPAPAVASAPGAASPSRPMGQFSPGDERAIDVTSSMKVDPAKSEVSAQLTESSGVVTPLPSTKGAGWDIVKYNNRDYVTAASIQRFYNFSSLKVEGSHLWLKAPNLILKGQVGSMEMLINKIKFILSYPVAESGGKTIISRLDLCKLIDPVLRPSFIAGADVIDTIVLDAGHGGHDSGAKGVYGYEKDFALKMTMTTKAALEKKGFKVILTRKDDTFISRTGRVAIANKTPNSIFISLHFNSGGSSATGIETFALTPQGSSASIERGGGYNASGLTGNHQDSENIALATAVHALVISRFKLVDRGIKRAQWTVLTGCNRPGILFEGGFITNGTECRLIASTTYRDAVANTIADAVVNYRKALTPQRGSMVDQNPRR